MSRRPTKPKRAPGRAPNLPQHNLPEPYNRLLSIGEDFSYEVYEQVAAELLKGDADKAVDQLLAIANDDTYYEYAALTGALNHDDGLDDPRLWVRGHALYTLSLLGPAAVRAIDRLLPFLDDMDEDILEDLPGVFGNIGEPAIEPLINVLETGNEDVRPVAVECLVGVAEMHPDTEKRILPILEARLATETEDFYLNGTIVIGLIDLGAVDMMPLIRQAFEEKRVDALVVDLPDVEEAFGMEITTQRQPFAYPDMDDDLDGEYDEELPAPDQEPEALSEPIGEPGVPYVAPVKAGRNDPCPCGSGKKYKKCCGA